MSVNSKMTAIADAIREKAGITGALTLDEMAIQINELQVGGGSEEPDYSVEDALVTRNVTSYANDRVTTIGTYAFGYCYSLTTVSFPAATSIGYGAFASCTSLTTVNFPAATSIKLSAFYNCRNLAEVSFPAVTTIDDYAFGYCYSLTTVSFPAATSIGPGAFARCYNLKAFYLPGSKVCTLNYSTAFSYTPIGGYSTSAGTYGSIYVPASLLTTYKAATNWTYFSSRFVAISE